MPLSSETLQIVDSVERLSGRPVHVEEDATMKLLATVVTARGSAPAHFVRFKPGTGAADYLVAFQLGFLVRLFSCLPSERREVVASDVERQSAVDSLGLMAVPRDFGHSLVGQLITQMRTFAIGFRVDTWLRKNFPALRSEQEHAARTQLIENENALSPEVRRSFPKPLVDKNSAMNAAFASFWAELLKERRYAIPYSALGYDTAGKKLLSLLADIPDEPAADPLLIRQWGETLGLTSFFHFEPHTLC